MENPDFSEQGRIVKTLIGEPVGRPDGLSVALYKTDGAVEALVGYSVNSGVVAEYTDEEVTRLGKGNWDEGLIRIAQAKYFAESTGAFTVRPFQAELESKQE